MIRSVELNDGTVLTLNEAIQLSLDVNSLLGKSTLALVEANDEMQRLLNDVISENLELRAKLSHAIDLGYTQEQVNSA